MSETSGSTPKPIEPNALLELVTGKTLNNLIEVRESVITELSQARDIAESLMSGTSEEVISALRRILSSDVATTEYPALPSYVSRAQPHHKHMPLVVAALQADVPIWLHGEAGSGKSTTGRIAAASLNLDFRSISLGPTTSKSDLLGYRDAVGQYQSTGFREIYENGGTFLFDEVDNAHPSILTILNSSIANGHGEFPDGEVKRAENTRFIATANTIGRGATSEYVGRAPIDAATIDRFAFIPMDIDENLEESLILQTENPDDQIDIAEGDIPDPREWLALVRANRQAANELGIRTIISPRAAIYGVRLAECGIGKTWLHEMLIYKGMKPQDREKLSATAKMLSKTILHQLTKGEKAELNVSPPKEPEWTLMPRNQDIDDNLNEVLESSLVDKQNLAFAAALSWQFEKNFSRTFYTRKHTTAIYGVDRTLLGANITIQDFVRDILENRHTHAAILSQLPSPDIVGELDYFSQYRKFIRNLDVGMSPDTNSMTEFRRQFEEIYSFKPGPYTLGWWVGRIRNT